MSIRYSKKGQEQSLYKAKWTRLRVKVTTFICFISWSIYLFRDRARVVAIRYLRTCQGRVVHLNWIVISASRSSVSPLAVFFNKVTSRRFNARTSCDGDYSACNAFLRSLSANRSNVFICNVEFLRLCVSISSLTICHHRRYISVKIYARE